MDVLRCSIVKTFINAGYSIASKEELAKYQPIIDLGVFRILTNDGWEYCRSACDIPPFASCTNACWFKRRDE